MLHKHIVGTESEEEEVGCAVWAVQRRSAKFPSSGEPVLLVPVL